MDQLANKSSFFMWGMLNTANHLHSPKLHFFNGSTSPPMVRLLYTEMEQRTQPLDEHKQQNLCVGNDRPIANLQPIFFYYVACFFLTMAFFILNEQRSICFFGKTMQ